MREGAASLAPEAIPALLVADKPQPVRSGRVGPLKLALLHIGAHAYGFGLSPKTYIAGAWWRLWGKKVRSRSRLAPLIGRSPYAYQLWLAGQPSDKIATTQASASQFSANIVVIVDARCGAERLDDTLASISPATCDIIVLGHGTDAVPTLGDAATLIDWREDRWILPIKSGDRLATHAIGYYAQASAASDARLIFADDDILDASGLRRDPHFKPDWNEDLLRHHDYVTGSALVKVSRKDFAAAANTSDEFSELIRVAAHDAEPVHLPLVLHHRRHRPAPRIPATADNRETASLPPVSLIVPTRNGVDLLRTCLEGVSQTDYPALETLVVDNGSDDPETINFLKSGNGSQFRVLQHNGPFNYSAINNAAVRATNGTLLCFLNNDIEMLEPNWLRVLAVHAMRGDVGAVGPMLLYPDGTVQHAGVVIGVGGGAGHAHRNVRPDDEGYFRRHALPQFVSAVTGACLVVKRDRFDTVGGFDEDNFPVAFNDVDLCLKLGARGFRSFYEPRARLSHHESKSRGHDRDPVGARRLAGELAALKRIWGTDRRSDPYHHPSLSQFSEQFVVGL